MLGRNSNFFHIYPYKDQQRLMKLQLWAWGPGLAFFLSDYISFNPLENPVRSGVLALVKEGESEAHREK